MKEFGLYIHIPFCIRKCYYCDFNSIAYQKEYSKRFLQALQEEIRFLAEAYHPTIKTIFIGGGTPTVLTGQQLQGILKDCYSNFDLLDGVEITIEANPGTINKRKLALLKEAGVNRLSLGVQAFDDKFLKELGRIHTVQEAIDNYYLAREIGFDNISLDLMFALPNQSLSNWQETLNRALQLKPEHLSTYNLKIEEGTRFYSLLTEGELSLVDEDLDLEMYQLAENLLRKQGYEQYEISNFARPNYRSRHNQIYWKNEPYLVLGPGAHFYDGLGRGYNEVKISNYIDKINTGKLPVAHYQELSFEEEVEESLMLGLRLIDGISINNFRDRFNLSMYDLYEEEIARLSSQQLVEVKGDRLRLTAKGILLANRVLAEFILS